MVSKILLDTLRNISWRIPKHTSIDNHIFVMGAPRSGTTLLQTILSAHPNISGSQRESGIFTRQNIFNAKRQFCDLNEQQILSIYQESSDIVNFFDNIARAVKKREGGMRFLEKTPQHILKIPFLLKYFPKAQFICIYRDGRDCYCSARKHQGIPQGSNLAKYAIYWKKCIEAQLKARTNDNMLEVKYEHLTNSPKTEIQRIMVFLKEQFDSNQINPKYYSMDKRSYLPQFSMLRKDITPVSQQRWRKELTLHEIDRFNRLAAKQLSALGYEIG